ncbi:GNAT family N-acetyltransferase [bacterium]|nr:GNAT family N-acetyltransferase [bacterium]
MPDKKKRIIKLEDSGHGGIATDDAYSDRVRCDHPEVEDASQLADSLIEAAEDSGRGKVMTMVEGEHVEDFMRQGFRLAGVMPDYYNGEADCAVMTYNVDEARRFLANPVEVSRVSELLKDVNGLDGADLAMMEKQASKTIRATFEDAEEIAALLGETFKDYPTPSHEAAYVRKQIQEGTPFRFIRDGEKMIACASADLIPEARAAELTDCATNPAYRKKGLMSKVLSGLILDLKGMEYATAYTFSRARIPGINIVFKKLGFLYCGQLSQSCRIGDGLEDMNIWCRKIVSNVL